jgi:similar to stage IV sporulation protein
VSDVSVPLLQSEYRLTGEQQQNHYFVAGSYAIRLWPFQNQPFVHAESSEQRYQLAYGQFSLPIGWKTETLRETVANTRKLSMDEALLIGKKFARQDVLKRAGEEATIKDEKVLHAKAESGKVYLRIHYSVIEDIAAEQPIVSLPPVPKTDDKKND